ncbi:TPA: hypothetical protein SAN82_001852 [Pseudomonas putida]|nr:hypothetical protein [Pseudomonas putida]
MAGNSLVEIVEKMKAGTITRGWGAICGFTRDNLNRVLMQQWLAKYDGKQYLPMFSGKMDLNNAKTEYGELKNVMLGKPLLSFEPSTLLNSKAKLTLSMLGGNFAAFDDTYGLLYEFEITEDLGYTLVVELDLSVITGHIDRRGRVTMDLSKGTKFTCNLAAPAESQAKIGAWFDQTFKALPPELQVYVLGLLDLKGESDLIPKSFMLLTQPAPGSKVKGALNAGDGAVLVMVQLRGDSSPGSIPGSTFPYLFPNDGDYSAFMLLAEKYASRSDPEKEEWIQTLLFPGEKNTFVETSRHTPKDMVVFGRLAPAQTSLTIVPDMHVMKAGGAPVAYKAYFNGAVKAVTWRVESLNSNTSAGTINPATGLYQPVSASVIGRELVRNVIVASYEDPVTKLKHEVRALLLVSTRAMGISPGVATRIEGQTRTVTFVATALSGSKLTWKPPKYGKLVANGNTAVYTPPPASIRRRLPEWAVEDSVVVTDDKGESIEATVVLTKAAATLKIDPPFVNGLARSGAVSFSAPIPEVNVETKWSVIGEGTITPEGVYKASATNTRAHDVVTCEISYMDVPLYAGFSIVRLARHNEEPGWTELEQFKLEALSAKRAFANGRQQIHVEAIIETNGARLTLEEESSLRIYYVNSNQQVIDVPAEQEGIEPEPPLPTPLWAQTRVANRFKPFPNNSTVDKRSGKRAGIPNRVSVFMVNRAVETTRFYAVLHDAQGIPWRSDIVSTNEGIITLERVPVPTADIEHFKLSRFRAEGGGGVEDPQNPDADFDYYLDTRDNWTLSYQRDGQVGVNFQIADVRGSKSAVQWESTANNETMFSYFGYSYNDPLKKEDQSVVHYDKVLIENLGIPVNPVITPALAEGVFKISLFRLGHSHAIRQDKFPALHALRNKTLNLDLTDNEGNEHSLYIGIRPTDRNRLYVDFRDGKLRSRKLSKPGSRDTKKASVKKLGGKVDATSKA